MEMDKALHLRAAIKGNRIKRQWYKIAWKYGSKLLKTLGLGELEATFAG